MDKVAIAAEGREALVVEAEALRRIAPALEGSVHAPRLLAEEPGLLLLEVIPWVHRLRPWRLPAEVAESLGSLAGKDFSHGDCAPWNLLRTAEGWVLCDWEESHALDGPFWDLWHCVIQAHALLGRPARRAVLRGLRGEGWVGEAVSAYAEGARLARRAAADGLRAYPDESARRLDPGHEDDARGLAARWSLAVALEAGGWR